MDFLMVTHRERQVLDHLRAQQWRSRISLPVPIGDKLLASLLRKGWLEEDGDALRITLPGLNAMRANV